MFAKPFNVLLALSLFSGGLNAQVRIAGDLDSTTFRDVRSAVGSALNGDLVVISAGHYSGFEIDGKSLTIAAEPGAVVVIDSPIVVRNLAAHQRVFLGGLRVEVGWEQVPAGFGDFFGLDALTIEDSEGHVQVQDCQLNGGDMTGFDDEEPGGDAAVIYSSSRVSFIGCTVSGGTGAADPSCGFGKGYGGPSGDGIYMLYSDVAVLDCALNGGEGGEHCSLGGDGGDGIRARGGTLFAANSTLTGGNGGLASDSVAFHGGSGGDGLDISAGNVARLLDSVSGGGVPGPPVYPNYNVAGVAIRESGGASAVSIDGHHVVMDAPGVAFPQSPIQVTFNGDPGTNVRLMYGRRPDFFQLPTAFTGVLLQRGTFPFALALRPAIHLDATGAASLSVPLPSVPPSVSHGFLYLQPLILGSSGFEVSAARSVVVVNDELGPDCNNNGVNDIQEVFAGALDANDNLVPDECDPTAPIYVDDDATPGGDGSRAAPFQTIGEAVSAVPADGTIIVLDGLYVGPGNRDLELDGPRVQVVSQNGPAGCIIDCQGMGRAFDVTADEVQIVGFTVRNGSAFGPSLDGAGGAVLIQGSSTRLSSCVFSNNTAFFAGGGAICTYGDDLSIEDCVFHQNSASKGGAVVFNGGPLQEGVVRRCTFESNSAESGGAIHMNGGVVSHCSFLENTAGQFGGALQVLDGVVSHCSFLENSSGQVGGALSLRSGSIDNCLFAGNGSRRGGAVGVTAFGGADISQCTFVNNTADQRGGALFLDGQDRLFNSILWGNTAPQGAQIRLVGPSSELQADFTDSQGGSAAVDQNGGTLVWGAGNLDIDPLFADPLGPDGLASTTIDNDYSLGPMSPCSDAAANHFLAFDLADVDADGLTGERVSLDLAGKPRRADDPLAPNSGSGLNPITDMGPFER